MAVARSAIRVTGLKEFQARLKVMDAKLPREIRIVLNDVAQLVVRGAEPMVVRGKTGNAAASIRVMSTQREARVRAGGAKAPYYGFLDFGGNVGRNRSVHRPFIKEGRYMIPAYRARQGEILTKMSAGLIHLARSSGVEVDY